MLLLCVVEIFVLIFSEHFAANAEFFQFEEATFQCEHNVVIADLSRVEWKINTQLCASMEIEKGNVLSVSYNCGLEPRANLTATNLTIFSLETRDDGEFSCTAVENDFTTKAEGAKFNVSVKVRAKDHRLLYNSNSNNCNDEVIVDNVPSNLMLKCSVVSRPQATFSWSTNPPVSESLLNNTECDQDSDLVYNCTNVLTLPSNMITQSIVVTCYVHALGNTTELCIKLAPLTTTQLMTTTVEDTSTASPSTTTEPLTTTELITTTGETTSIASPSSTTTAASTATTKSGSSVTEETSSSTSSPTTATQRFPIYTAHMMLRLKSEKFEDHYKDANTLEFKNMSKNVCNPMHNSFNESLLNCIVTGIRPGSVLIDGTLQFNQDALKEELKDLLLRTDNIEDAVKQKIQQSEAPVFQDAEISISADEFTKSSATTPTNPPPASKWKDIYILPIVVGVAIIIVVVVVMIYRSRHHSTTSNESKKARKLNSHRPPYAMQIAAYDTIPDTTPVRPRMTSQQPYANNDGRHRHKEVQGQLNKKSNGAMRRSEPADRNDNYRRPGQMCKNGHGAARRIEPAKFNKRQSRPHVDRQFQHSAAASAGYRVSRGYSVYQGYPSTRDYPAYGGYPATRSQMPVMSHGDRSARAYNSYTGAPNY